ncbi:VOC family protein [Macrococcus hajekii]|uniref:VOC family protein n=1 Tax=Macrococcus hajekii TaxID=198482 RepID=A0A4R6BJ01_9STAP|nr:VOC family protein [Macrococcus hajekii]TDM01570.1 VOC family protein [Macrococcus hajekii]GGB01092.1 VOC family protein [Macrococcus hajekii]
MNMQKVVPFMMFNGRAEEAVDFYTTIFNNSEIATMNRYGTEGPGAEGTINHSIFTLNGQQFMAIDNANGTDVPFTPALSFVVNCDSEEEIRHLYNRLSTNGEVLMKLAPMPPVARQFAWVVDRFGLSWQLNLAA